MARQGSSPATWGPRQDMRVINADVPRVDGPLKVTGRARYSHDVRLPGMLWGRALCCPYPVAKALLDFDAARAVPGVQVVLPLEDGLRDGWTRRLGMPIAAVAAETPEAAEDALQALNPRYEEGEWAVDYDQAVAPGAPKVHEEGNIRFLQTNGEEEAAEAALDGCDAVVEAVYTLPVQFHACLETHGVVVDYRGGDEATIHASTQGTFTIAGEAAQILGLPQNKVTVLVDHMGGGFGAKFGLDLPGRIACLLAREARAPVHLMFTRADEFHSAGNRSGSTQYMKAGASADGELKALTSRIWKFGGVGRGSNPGQPYIYRVGTSYMEAGSILTNTDGSRAMRAPGHPQASFAIESVVDELAVELGKDPLEFRKKNLESEVYHRQLDRVAQEIGWNEHPHKLGPPKELPDLATGIGFGVSTWGAGGRPTCEVDVRISQDGSVTSSVGTQDLGTGTRTYVASIVAEELGLPVAGVRAHIGDSRLGASVASGGSVTTPSLAPAVKDAAHKARMALFAVVAELFGSDPANLVARTGEVFDTEESDKRMSWNEACACLPPAGIEERGTFVRGLAANGVHGAQAARVEVDTVTGEMRVVKMVCIQDIGLPLNRLATRSQINGGMIQALSYGLFEERILDPWLGLGLNNGFEEYRIAGTQDIPEMVSIIDDEDTRDAVLGVGEPVVIPGQSAIANALYNACGVRIRDLPLSRDKIINGLAAL